MMSSFFRNMGDRNMTIEQKAVKAYGLTDFPQLALWLLKDGSYINGTIEGYQRDIDHHEISSFFKRSVRQEPGSNGIYVYKFMNRGNIRVGCSESGWCYEFTRIPTKNQIDMMFNAIIEAKNHMTKAYFGRNPKTSYKTIWENGCAFLRYINRYTDYRIPDALLQYYCEETGMFLSGY